MCDKEGCKDMINEDRSLNGRRLLHTKQECQLLSESGLGGCIDEFENDNVIFACIFLHRM